MIDTIAPITVIPETIHARVTAGNIADTSPRDTVADCLCARALRETTGDDWWVGVTRARRIKDNKLFVISSTVVVWDAIIEWMSGRPVEPFEFVVVDND